MHALLAGVANKKTDLICASQLQPWFANRRALQRELGVSFEHAEVQTFADIERACSEAASRVKTFIVRPTWRASADEAVESMARLRARFPEHRIVFMDPWDQATGRYLGVAAHVDRLMKYQGLKNKADYARAWEGGTVITDYFARELGYDLAGWHAGSLAPADCVDRIMTGWHLSTTRRFRWEIFRPQVWPLVPMRRELDVVCHVSYGRKNGDFHDWYSRHRRAAVEALRQLPARYKTSISGEYDEERSVSRAQYLHDMKHARIAVSPFGWGEVTWRDYEAICNGSLLIKPRVDHVDVQPDIVIPGKTYVPVKWDFSDLEETCRYYLDNWDKAEAIIAQARRSYRSFFTDRVALKIAAQALDIPSSSLRGGAASA